MADAIADVLGNEYVCRRALDEWCKTAVDACKQGVTLHHQAFSAVRPSWVHDEGVVDYGDYGSETGALRMLACCAKDRIPPPRWVIEASMGIVRPTLHFPKASLRCMYFGAAGYGVNCRTECDYLAWLAGAIRTRCWAVARRALRLRMSHEEVQAPECHNGRRTMGWVTASIVAATVPYLSVLRRALRVLCPCRVREDDLLAIYTVAVVTRAARCARAVLAWTRERISGDWFATVLRQHACRIRVRAAPMLASKMFARLLGRNGSKPILMYDATKEQMLQRLVKPTCREIATVVLTGGLSYAAS